MAVLAIVLSALLLTTLAPPAASAAPCTTPAEARAVKRAARTQARCNYKLMRTGTGEVCTNPVAPPACAGTLVDDAIALAYGPNDPPASTVDRAALRRQLACQQKIGRGVARFVGVKLTSLIDGQSLDEAVERARKILDRLAGRCAVAVAQDVSGVVLPAVGTPCQNPVGGPGATVDADAVGACLIAALETMVDAVVPAPPPRPNLVIVLTDDQRWDTTDLTHSIDGVTPVMPEVQSELVASGVHFPNAFVTTALCCPSRASILAGQYAHTTTVLTNTQPLGGAPNFDDSASLATWLQGQGYQTGLFGKYLNGYNQLWTPPEQPYVPPGWTEWHAFAGAKFYDYNLVENGVGFDHALVSYPSACPTYTGCPADEAGEDPCPAPQNYSTDLLLQKALDFIDQSAGQPFFLYLAPYAPHGPACPAMQDEGSFDAIPAWRPPNFNEADVSDKPMWVQERCPMTTNQQTANDNFRKQQLEALQAVDRAVGALMDKLRQVGEDADTLFIYTADNGYSWGAHCHRPKRCPYDECMRVPMVVRYPVLAPLARTDPRLALNIDIAFTFGELAGVVPPIVQDGRSMARLLPDDEPAWRTDFLYEQWLDVDPEEEPESPPTLAGVRNEEWKYVEYVTNETELYDLQADPFELQNETNNPTFAGVKMQMAERLRQLRPDW